MPFAAPDARGPDEAGGAGASPSVGLTSAEVAARVARGLVNRLPSSQRREYIDIFRRNLVTVFNALVAPAAVVLFLLEEYPAAWAVSAMALINSGVGLFQEVRAKRHLDRLTLLSEARVRVVRDGAEKEVLARDVVQDDHLLLATGDAVIVDGVLRTAQFLEIDEALLTGESDPVPRHVGERILSGSFCVAGEGSYQAERVGPTTFANETAATARRYRYVGSPLQRIIDRLIRILTGATLALCGLYLLLYVLHELSGKDLVRMVAATVTLLVPQGLVLTSTMALLLGAVHLSSRGAVVQQLRAVESMAAVTILCLDKTGTLTTNRLRLDHLRLLDRSIEEEVIRARLGAFAWLSTDVRNRSIQALRAGLGASPDGVKRLDEIPFKSQNRYSAVRASMAGREHLLVLGACESLGPHLDAGLRPAVEEALQDMLRTGLRLLLFAEGFEENRTCAEPLAGALPALPLRPLALVALSDEPRPGASGILSALQAQGLQIKVLSGDHPETIRATVHALGLPLKSTDVASGDDLARAANAGELIESRDVFGRVTPAQKLDIITYLQGQGHHVAMVGDGINDILSIKRADLGIAMGEGSAAVRDVAGLVLENNDFALLPAALSEGRTILGNVRRVSKLFLLKNVYALFLIVALVGLFRDDFPLLPQQVTLLNALTIGIPVFVLILLGSECAAPVREGFLKEVGLFVISTGVVVAVAGVLLFLAAGWLSEGNVTMQRSVLLAGLVLLGLGNLWRVLGPMPVPPTMGDRLVRTWSVLALLLLGSALYIPLISRFFELKRLAAIEWAVVLAVAGPAYLLCRLLDRGGVARGANENRRAS